MNERIEELIKATKINELIRKNDVKEKKKNTNYTPPDKKKYTWFLCIFFFGRWNTNKCFFCFLIIGGSVSDRH